MYVGVAVVVTVSKWLVAAKLTVTGVNSSIWLVSAMIACQMTNMYGIQSVTARERGIRPKQVHGNVRLTVQWWVESLVGETVGESVGK